MLGWNIWAHFKRQTKNPVGIAETRLCIAGANITSLKAPLKSVHLCCHIQESQSNMSEYKLSHAGGNLCIAAKKCFLRGRRAPAHADPCGTAKPTNSALLCWPSSQLQRLLRLKIDSQRESSKERKGLLENSTAIFDSTFTAWYKIQVKPLFYTGYSVRLIIRGIVYDCIHVYVKIDAFWNVDEELVPSDLTFFVCYS